MSCIIDSGYSINTCEDRVGGIKRFAIQNYSSSTIFGLTASDQVILTMSPTASFYVAEQELEAGIVVGTIEPSENGSTFVTYVMTIRFETYSLETRRLIEALIKTRVRVAVETNSDDWILLGYSNPGRVSGGALGPNQNFGDLAGGTVEITFREKGPAKFIDSTLIEGLLINPS
jgi:hypothetical protein